MLKKLVRIIPISLIMLLSIAAYTFAAESTSIDQSVLKEVEQNMIDLGIDKSTREILISKLLRGELLDSCNPEIVNAKIEEVITSSNVDSQTFIFPDGSRFKISKTLVTEKVKSPIKNPKTSFEPIQPMATIIENTYWVNAKGIFIDASFWVDSLQNLDWNEARIIKIYSPNYAVTAGTVDNYSFSILRDLYEYPNPAKAEMSFFYTIYFPPTGVPLHSGIFRLWTTVTPTSINQGSSGLV